MDQKVQLVINGHNNKKQNIETRILQRSPVSSILFLIYISRVFEQIIESYLGISYLLFIDDVGFIAFRCLVKELTNILGQLAKVILEWGKSNAVIYDIAKTKVVLFSKSHCQRLNKQINVVHIKIRAEKIKFNKEVI